MVKLLCLDYFTSGSDGRLISPDMTGCTVFYLANTLAQCQVVREKYETHKRGMELLSEGPSALAASVPHAGGGTVDNNTSSAGKLRTLMEHVGSLQYC